jgi:hypothetical protein
MSELLLELIEKTKSLAKEEKAMLIDVLRSELDETDAEWSRAWLLECERRAAAVDRGESQAIPAEEVLAQIREKLSPA